MSVEVYFNTPFSEIPREKIIDDILSESGIVVIASAWFTDIDLADAFINSRALHKTIILNASDKLRGSRKSYEMIDNYFVDSHNTHKCRDTFLTDNLGIRSCTYAPPDGVFVVGSNNWHEGVMHHKFIVLFNQHIVWTGSYNYTIQARKNYENILRISDEYIAIKYIDEARSLATIQYVIEGPSQFGWNDKYFRCGACDNVYVLEEIGVNHYSWFECKYCFEKSR